jgi:hypothetical protein
LLSKTIIGSGLKTSRLTTAFEAALGKLGLVDRSVDPTIATLAKLIIELAKAGEREPERLCESALKRLLK